MGLERREAGGQPEQVNSLGWHQAGSNPADDRPGGPGGGGSRRLGGVCVCGEGGSGRSAMLCCARSILKGPPGEHSELGSCWHTLAVLLAFAVPCVLMGPVSCPSLTRLSNEIA